MTPPYGGRTSRARRDRRSGHDKSLTSQPSEPAERRLPILMRLAELSNDIRKIVGQRLEAGNDFMSPGGVLGQPTR